jgi:hypothetical protein
MERAELHRLDGVFDRRERGDQDDRQVGGALLHLAQHRQTIPVRQLELQEDQVVLVPLGPQPLPQRSAHQLLVVHD